MDLSIITGSRSAADNITSFYAFGLGVVAGSFLVVGFAEFDMAHQMRGDLLRVYLALITAMLGGGIGLFASRIGDRIADRRNRRRKLYFYRTHIVDLISELSFFSNTIAEVTANGTRKIDVMGVALTEEKTNSILIGIDRVHAVALEQPDHSDIVDSDEDLDRVHIVRERFRYLADLLRDFGLNATAEKDKKPTAARFATTALRASYKLQLERLRAAAEYFAERTASF